MLALAACGVALVSSGCQVRAHQTDAFVRRAGGISLTHPTMPAGEALIHVRNDSVEPARLVFAKVDSPDVRLPVGPDGTVPVGTAADLEYTGAGYKVLVKPDDVAPYFAHGRTTTTLHLHLTHGYYVLFSNRPGDYEGGRRTVLKVR